MPEEKEKSKGISLRKKSKSKRLVISAPRAQVPESTSASQSKSAPSKPAESTARPRAPTGGKTSDLVKRRYSTRFTHIPQDFNANAPAVPALPPSLAQNAAAFSSSRDGQSSASQGITVDTAALKDQRLDPDKYVANVLAEASSEDIDMYRKNLQKMRSRASTDLQQNVYQNRTQFIKISKEAERLRGEMRTLQGLMSELRTNTNVMGQTLSLSDSTIGGYDSMTSSARKLANRSSVAHLEAMWKTQLQSLSKNVEGSQKFLPAAPGRHVVRDSPHWVELNAATWKPRRIMHMFLLNDHLLVASRKKKRVEQSINGTTGSKQAVPTKLVAERCWPLQEIQILDLASTASSSSPSVPRRDFSEVADAINIRVGSESFTYRNDKADGSEKVGLLLSFRKTLEELRRALRSEPSSAAKVVDNLNYFAARDPGLLKQTSLLESLSETKDRPNIMIDVDGKQQNLRWVEMQMDELDIEIALQRFSEAVERVENLRRLATSLRAKNAMAQDLINFKVDERAARLASVITRRLVDGHSFKDATHRNADLLSRLGFEDRAREAYLESRSEIIQKRVRQCTFTGDLPAYIFSLSYVTFTLTANTITIFGACFPPAMMSACVKWAHEHIETFNTTLERQLTDVNPELRARCLDTARVHSKVLQDVGLDFGGLVAEGGLAKSKRPAEIKEGVGLGLR